VTYQATMSSYRQAWSVTNTAASGTQEAAGGFQAVSVRRLDVTNFRCYPAARLDVDARPVVLTGPNGAGKTNLLEAISFLAPGRGLRRARLSEIDHRPGSAGVPIEATGTLHATGWSAGAWAVSTVLDTPSGEVHIGTGRDASSLSSERRVLRIDGVAARGQAALADHVTLVWLTPQMDRLFVEGASARRRFLDRLVLGFDRDHGTRVAEYEHALRERARLLRDGPADPAWLAALEDTLARQGVAVAASRREVTQRLDRSCRDGIGPFPVARLALIGTAESWLATMPALAAEDRLRAELEAGRRIDRASGVTLVGPHRSDLAVRHGGRDVAAAECSTGEQKALLISILLAHARLQSMDRGQPPVMLLDEVAAHLDRGRRAALYDEISALGCQAWLTGTDEVLFDGLRGRAQFYQVADAALVRVTDE
jgi:DNA replication and repair protein RecF